MHIVIGSDHAGFALKSLLVPYLLELNYTVKDIGPETGRQSCDYPDFAKQVCDEVLASGGLGLLICGTGIGMSMAANRVKGIRAALCGTEFQARYSRMHNDANVLCIGARVVGDSLAKAILDDFLKTEFEGGRHLARIQKFDL